MLPGYFPFGLRRCFEWEKTLLWRRKRQEGKGRAMSIVPCLGGCLSESILFIGINLVGGLGLRGRGGRLANAALEGGDMSVSLLFDSASRLMFCEMMCEPGRFGFSAMFLWVSPFILISRKGRI